VDAPAPENEIETMKWIRQRKHQAAFDEIETQLTLAEHISRLTIRSSSAQEIARDTALKLSELMPIDNASLAILDKPADRAILTFLVGRTDLEEQIITQLADTPVAWVVENKQALLETDQKDMKTAILGERMATQVHMPLFYQGEVFGVISIGSHESNAYTPAQLKILRYTVIHLATSLKSFLFLDQNLRTEASLTDLSELLGIITSKAELPEAFPEFAERLKKIIPFNHISLVRIEGNILRNLAVVCEKEDYLKANDALSFTDSAIPWLRQHGEVNIEENLEHESLFPVDKTHLENGVKGVIRVPLFSHGKLSASLDMMSCEPYYSNEATDFLKQLAQYLATPVESYMLYIHEKQRLDWLIALSHHLKTPLTPIISSSQLLVGEFQQEDESPLAKLARNILTGAEKLDQNIKIFWDLSEIEAPDFELKFEAVDPNPILRQAVEEASAAAKTKSQSLTLESSETLPYISVDPLRIKQLLRILLENSIEVSPEEGKIELLVKITGGQLVVEVADSGQALSPEQIEKLLQPYRLSEADRRSLPKLTLNLAISRRIIELHGGSFMLWSNPEKGNVFGFSLPT